jgi:hypothetical protein
MMRLVRGRHARPTKIAGTAQNYEDAGRTRTSVATERNEDGRENLIRPFGAGFGLVRQPGGAEQESRGVEFE